MTAGTALRQRFEASFAGAFGRHPDLIVASPGRVNLIGEHTDYNDGFVMPCAIDRFTLVAVARANHNEARVVAADYGDTVDHFDARIPIAHSGLRWANYIRGSVDQLAARGFVPHGFDMAVAGDIPQGTGLSSSASLEVGVITALSALFDWNIAPSDAALIGQSAENHFVGMACGIMDQMIAARGKADHATVIDCRTLECHAQRLPQGIAVAILNSRVERGLVDSAYNDRRRQCEEAARRLDVTALRDIDPSALECARHTLPEMIFARANHVVGENARVLETRDALARGDLAAVGGLMRASHVSMRDDFEITVPAIDRLVEIANQSIGEAGGARMTGGGFGGCVVALLPRDDVRGLATAVARDYRAPNGQSAELFVCRAADGAMPI